MADNEEPANKRMKQSQVENTPLDDLPTEILLKIFGSLKINDLLRCGQVSNRIRSIAHHEKLWQKVNLQNWYRISAGLIQFILENGCKYISIGAFNVKGHLILTQKCQLKHLVAWFFLPPIKTLEEILASCNVLEKIDLQFVHLSESMFSSINQNGKTLKQLNMFGCSRPMDSYMDKTQFFEHFIHNCDVLTELNLQNVYCSDYSTDYLVNNLTVNIQKLNIYGMNINDHQIKVLVTRCNKITELNLKVSNESLNHILAYLQSTLEKLSFCGKIDLFKMFELKSMKKLKLLELREKWNPILLRGYNESYINVVKKKLPNIEIVQNSKNVIASNPIPSNFRN